MNPIIDMVTVGQGYAPLTGGANTIRKLTEKYANLRPGDLVSMDYVEEVDVDGGYYEASYGSELLEVAAIYGGSFESVIYQHWALNHANLECKQVVDKKSWLPWVRRNQVTYAEVSDLFQDHYGQLTPAEYFVAIYFK